MSKFSYNETPPDAVPIYQGYVRSVGYAEDGYQSLSAAVDALGNIYVAAHFPAAEGEPDRVWLLKSFDRGKTWSKPTVVCAAGDTSFSYPSLEVDHAGNLIVCFAVYAPSFLGGRKDEDKRIYFRKSTDRGETWGELVVVDSPAGPFGVYNPCLLEDRRGNLHIFAQRAGAGLVMATSRNGGGNWDGFSSIIVTSDYADPSAGVGADGTLYVTYRVDRLCGDTAPNIWRNCVARSTDGGRTWTLVHEYCGEGRVGPAGSIRYANWWNYGGPLEWCWEQYLRRDSNLRPVYFAIDPSVKIWDRTLSR
jgi:hypothetical protein